MKKVYELSREIADLQERKSNLATEAGNKEVKEERLAKIGTELDDINSQIKAKEEERAAAEAEEIRLRSTAKPIETHFAKDTEMEKRIAEAKKFVETRAITIASGTLVSPTRVGGINDKANEVSSIVDMTNVMDLNGLTEYQEAYVSATGTGDKTAEGTDAKDAEPVFEYASIKPVTITAYAEISRQATKLNPLAYMEKVKQLATVALKKKVSAYIVNGDAVSNAVFVGINTAGAEAIASASDLEIATIDATTLRKIVLGYGGDENIVGTGVLFLNKNDMAAFGAVRGTNEKKAIYEIIPDTNNPNMGVIKDGGTSARYCVNSNIPALSGAATLANTYCMFYGIPTNYLLGLFSDYDVQVSSDFQFKKGMYAIRGEVMIGGNVVVSNGFVRVKKA